MVTPIDASRLAARLAAAMRVRVARGRPEAPGHAAAAPASSSRAERGPRAAAAQPLLAVLRTRIRAIGAVGEPCRRAAARIFVEEFLARELEPTLRADPRFPGWIDQAVEALYAEPPFRAELDAVVERLLEDG